MAENVLTVMVVDDDELVRLCLAREARLMGCRVVQAAGPLEALELFEREQIEVVVTDYRMPRMNGVQLVGALRARRPELRCVLVSATPWEAKAELEASDVPVLDKPWDRALLRAAILEQSMRAAA